MVSQDIIDRRDEYMQVMRGHARMSRDEIVASLTESQARLHALFSAVPPEHASIKPAPDEWCVRELAMHAAFTERLVSKLVHHMARSEMPPAEYFVGAGIGMMPKDVGQPYADVLADLSRMNDGLIAAVRALPDEPDLEFKGPHPFFGPLNCLEWAGFQRVHDTDHMQHLQKILAATKT